MDHQHTSYKNLTLECPNQLQSKPSLLFKISSVFSLVSFCNSFISPYDIKTKVYTLMSSKIYGSKIFVYFFLRTGKTWYHNLHSLIVKHVISLCLCLSVCLSLFGVGGCSRLNILKWMLFFPQDLRCLHPPQFHIPPCDSLNPRIFFKILCF